MAKNTLPPAAVIRAARTLERYEVRELLRVAPDRNASLAGPARLLDAIRAWRAVFDPPKVRIRRFDIATRKHVRDHSLGALAARLHAGELDWKTIAKVNGLKTKRRPDNPTRGTSRNNLIGEQAARLSQRELEHLARNASCEYVEEGPDGKPIKRQAFVSVDKDGKVVWRNLRPSRTPHP